MLTGSAAASAESLNSLCAGAFLVCSLAMVATRQIQACLRFFYIQAVLLALSAVILAWQGGAAELLAFAGITVLGKSIALPLILRRVVPVGLMRRREIDQVFNIPTSLITAVLLAAVGFETMHVITADGVTTAHPVNAAVGMASLLVGILGLVQRREPLPQLVGLLAMENAVFLTGIAIGSTLSTLLELGITFDVLVLVVTVGLLAALIYRTESPGSSSEVDT